jgi:hypothetical protein|tara:strand:+ start:429 stop:602 length:174 start_codon:yes stop_codon:yes gene_type:complete
VAAAVEQVILQAQVDLVGAEQEVLLVQQQEQQEQLTLAVVVAVVVHQAMVVETVAVA